jgi:hypothetical protein
MISFPFKLLESLSLFLAVFVVENFSINNTNIIFNYIFYVLQKIKAEALVTILFTYFDVGKNKFA